MIAAEAPILTSDVIFGFANSILSKKYQDPSQTPRFHREVWELCASDNKFVAIAAPRHHGKSTVVTLVYVLASVLFRDKSFVIVVSDTEAQAAMFLGEIKEELENNEDIHALFGKPNLIKNTETDIIAIMPDRHAFKIIAKGSEQKLRGVKWRNRRPDLIVCDDLENDELVMNDHRREKFRNWFLRALLPSRASMGSVRVIGTVLHMDSLLERLMPKDHEKDVIRTPLADYALSRSRGWKAVKYRAHPKIGDYSELLWPDRWNETKLKEERELYLSQGNPEGYSQEYLNVPIDDSVSFFKRQDMLPMTKENIEKKDNKRWYVSADLAVSTRQRADYSVFIVASYDDEGVLCVEHIIRERMDSMDAVGTILGIQKVINPELFVMESGVIQKAIGPFLNAEMQKQNVYPFIEEVIPSTDKQARARSIQARMRAGGVRFNKQAEWWPVFESELLRFPRDVHDDCVDALAYLGMIVDKLTVGPSKEELEEEELLRDVSLQNEFRDYKQGRCPMTGY